MVTLNIPVERIGAQAREYDVRRFLLLCLVAVPLAVGWTARAVWWVASMAAAAVKVGWESGPASAPAGRSVRR